MILVVGGAGYIGSHVVKELLNQGKKVIVLYNLSTGFRFAVDPRAIFIEGELGDTTTLKELFNEYTISAVMHFAANSLVGESVVNPIILQHLNGRRNQITIYGQDYVTPDGTCIRDYIHVYDLNDAHILALEALLGTTVTNETYNLGNGQGCSVKEIIQTAEKITGNRACVQIGLRREGDPARLIASSKKIHEALGWTPKYSLDDIIQHAWNYQVKTH